MITVKLINFPAKNLFTYFFQHFKKICKRTTVQGSYFGRILRLFDFAKTSKVKSDHIFFILKKKNLGLTFWAKKCPDLLKKNYWHFALPRNITDFFQYCKRKSFCLSYSSASENSKNSNQKTQEHFLVYFNRLWQRKTSSAGACGLFVVM